MASYTMLLKDYIESITYGEGYSNTNDRIELARKKLFNFKYPIFDENYKVVFETNFIRNFYMREIGFETDDLFKFQLETWMLINMPYFNKMFESELISFNPLVNSEMSNEWSKTKDTDGKTDTTQDSEIDRVNNQDTNGKIIEDGFIRNLESDTPDNRLTITTDKDGGVIEYASRIEEDNENKSTSTDIRVAGSSKDLGKNIGKTTTNIVDTESYLQSKIGKVGSVSYSKMIMEYRDSFIRIEKQIFNEMNKLFMLVY